VLKAEIAKLDAEIQALATPDAIDTAQAAEEAGRSYKEQRDAAHEPDRLARDRRRAGRTPSPAARGHAIGPTLRAKDASASLRHDGPHVASPRPQPDMPTVSSSIVMAGST
jgi:hypothetical protein